ncbi:MAG: DUF3299 domain-containing protein [Alcaligenaceae bacterium]|nr:DUF3299 domain-containing protein [Alcaligenaceae bacterium]
MLTIDTTYSPIAPKHSRNFLQRACKNLFDTRVVYRTLTALLFVFSALFFGLFALPAAAQPTQYREISWEDLVPADWDPSASFKDLEDLMDLPDTDPRVLTLYERMRQVWDQAPVVKTLDQNNVRLPGFVVTLEKDTRGVSEFLLVPYFGACIHTPPPPANQIIHVKSPRPVADLETMDTVWIQGQLKIERGNSDMGISGYSLIADQVRPYAPDKPD